MVVLTHHFKKPRSHGADRAAATLCNMSGNIINLMLSSALGSTRGEEVANRAGREHVIEQHDTTKYLLLLGVDRPAVCGVYSMTERGIHSRTELTDRVDNRSCVSWWGSSGGGSCLTGIKSVYFLLLLE